VGSGLGREFGSLLAAVGGSGLGDGVRMTAFPLVTASVSQSPLAVSAVAVAQGVPWLLFSLPVGAMVDRWDRRAVVVRVNALRAVLVGGLAAAVALDLTSIALLAVVAFLMTTAEVVSDTASQALLPAVVRPADLERANGRLYAVQNATIQFVGPSLGGLLFVVHRAVPFLLDAASFVWAALFLRRLPPMPRVPSPQQPQRAPRRLRNEIAEGLQFLASRPVLRGLAITVFAGNVFIEGFYAVFVLFAFEEIGVGPAGYGVLFAVFALGGITGNTVAVSVKRVLGDGPAILAGSALTGLPLLLLGLFPTVPAAVGAMFLTGAAEGVWQVLTSSLRQALIPDWLLGRVSGAFRLTGRGAMFLGAAGAGVLAEVAGLRAPAIAAGIGIPLTALTLTGMLSTASIRRARAELADTG
jgi:MFS family permease